MKPQLEKPALRPLLLGAFICACLLTIGYLTMVNTPQGHKFDDDAFAGHDAVSWRVIKLDSAILNRVTKSALLFAAIMIFSVATLRRCAFVGLIAVAGFAFAVIGAEILKAVLPWRPLVPDDALLSADLQAESYPSGHATIGTSFALGVLLVAPSRWRLWFAVCAGCFSATFATAVLFAGWHRPSDALGALAWSGICMSIAGAFAVRVQGSPAASIAHSGRAVIATLAATVLVLVTTWLTAAGASPRFYLGNLPFFVLTGLIIVGAFGLNFWYAWQLKAVDWSPTPTNLKA
ncbi:MAG: phosphatase PAP2 family protein [Verrucomicrobia bacterium]|nr:phosphatase PAP2 family protein [Verrucomicrobiota bacterium]